MSDEGLSRTTLATKGFFVAIGLAYVALGPPLFGLEPAFVGSALAAYGIVSFVGQRIITRWGVLDR